MKINNTNTLAPTNKLCQYSVFCHVAGHWEQKGSIRNVIKAPDTRSILFIHLPSFPKVFTLWLMGLTLIYMLFFLLSTDFDFLCFKILYKCYHTLCLFLQAVLSPSSLFLSLSLSLSLSLAHYFTFEMYPY